MAKYTYLCTKCGWTKQQIVLLKAEVVCPTCSIVTERQLPTLNGPSRITEVVNKYTGTAWSPDHKEEITQRREDYYWSVEVPRFVDSGIYSMETMLENQWIWIDDDHQIHTYNKPPNRR